MTRLATWREHWPDRERENFSDPVDEAAYYARLHEAIGRFEADVVERRRQAIERAIASGVTQQDLAKAMGLSRARVSQIRSTGPRRQR